MVPLTWRIYLALHIAVARFSRAPDSRLLWFFSVVTGPLTRPFRALMPPAPRRLASASSPSWCSLVFLWIGARMLLGTLGGVNVG